MSSLQMANPIFASGGYTTVGGAYALRTQGTPNWGGARTGVGAATLTWGAGEAIDALESTVFYSCRTAGAYGNTAGQTDTTLLILTSDGAVPAAVEAAVDFLVMRIS